MTFWEYSNIDDPKAYPSCPSCSSIAISKHVSWTTNGQRWFCNSCGTRYNAKPLVENRPPEQPVR